MFKEIIAAFDGSDQSEAALLAACDLAAKYQANLHVVHVPQVDQPTAGVTGAAEGELSQEDALKQSGDVIIQRAETIAKEADQNLSSTKLLAGPTAQAILDFAQQQNADLIVSGRRGTGHLKGLLTGSVSRQLASDAACAILTVKAA